jgi:hypothetical protein
MKLTAITSDYAILDVKKGRAALERNFRGRPCIGHCPEHMRVPVKITGYIDAVFGDDDGTSREFCVTVERVEIEQPKGKP